MTVHKHRINSAVGAETTEDHDVDVAELDILGSAFSIDVVIARLADEGIEVVRSSPLDSRLGNVATNGEHKLVFRESDRPAVAEALRAAGIV